MRILQASVQNFSSYSELEFDFRDLGLALIYGPTGAGKSTLCDVACWCLFGRTAKNGNADDVRSWTADNQNTIGVIEVELPDAKIFVTRVRGRAGQNDLFWTENNEPTEIRGKDITETQARLEERLGVSADLYLAGGYYTDSSRSSGFFTAKAKERRELFETLAVLDFPTELGSRIVDRRKVLKNLLESSDKHYDKTVAQKDMLQLSLTDLKRDMQAWESRKDRIREKLKNFELEKQSKIEATRTRYEAFEVSRNSKIITLKALIESLDNKIKSEGVFVEKQRELEEGGRCEACGSLDQETHNKLMLVLSQRDQNLRLVDKRNDYVSKLTEEEDKANPYTELLEDAKNLRNTREEALESEEENPFAARIEALTQKIQAKIQEVSDLAKEVAETEAELSSLEQLSELASDLRGVLLQKTVREIQDNVNVLLEAHFEAPLRVEFEMEGSDDLKVTIRKSGYECSYRQLSKGQRQLLRLCFSVSVMKAASNRAGIHFSQIMFDEALDGLDSDLKIKAFSLFEELSKSHESVLLIDHAPEFQSLFARKYLVSLDGDTSVIEVENE